ncbi:MAG: GNAT family N-acetyltransferase [Reichenbachiella sp.]|uniref:GNAT family N-acetyltransferase n=1 Tax=Reichenbachiella sp. TaxID=2184521 RepID=UPI003267576B
MNATYTIRDAKPEEFQTIGELMVKVYAQLEGFPKPVEQPTYYDKLANIGNFTENPETRLLVAVSSEGHIGGGVVYFGDMEYYGSGGTATHEKNAAGFRLLAVDPDVRGGGLGKLLTKTCLDIARTEGQKTMVIHSTKAMQVAWAMYESMGFERALDLDFMQGELAVYGFRLALRKG